MATRTLERPPSMLPLYARALAPLVPGASRLPWVGGGGGAMPELELTVAQLEIDREQVARYASVCGFDTGERELPASYPHVPAFALHMALMSDGRFPFPAVGLVHIANRISQRRTLHVDERLDVRVRPTAVQPHARGRAFSILTEVRSGGELVWLEQSTMLRRGGAGAGAVDLPGEDAPSEREPLAGPPRREWRLAGDLGRRYAGVSGDRNPIHMHPLAAKAFGFPRAIAHGMWTKARCLAELQAAGELPAAFTAEVRFRRPILLPASVLYTSAAEGSATRFAVRDAKRATEHLEGHVQPLEDIDREQEEL